MAELAVGLLGLASTGSVAGDLGCGSGLSATALRKISRAAWVGLDITPEMLHIAASDGEARGHLALADLTQGLPLRSQTLDGAISISTIQVSMKLLYSCLLPFTE
jgi:predicted TPR repeat methyltransferase